MFESMFDLMWLLDHRTDERPEGVPQKPLSLQQALRVLKKSELQFGPSWSWVSKQWRGRFGSFMVARPEHK